MAVRSYLTTEGLYSKEIYHLVPKRTEEEVFDARIRYDFCFTTIFIRILVCLNETHLFKEESSASHTVLSTDT